jgi:hypothetical protein
MFNVNFTVTYPIEDIHILRPAFFSNVFNLIKRLGEMALNLEVFRCGHLPETSKELVGARRHEARSQHRFHEPFVRRQVRSKPTTFFYE